MIGYEIVLVQNAIDRQELEWREAERKMDRDLYEMMHWRGPMIERDIDWTAPLPNRPMEEGDL
jgi:hypothetical protein